MGHILIVDDCADIRRILRRILATDGYTTKEAEHGKAALSSMDAEGLPELILLDMNMPEMNGEEFMKALRSDQTLATIPVIMVAAIEPSAAPEGISFFIPKPIEIPELLSVIARLIRRPQQQPMT